MDWKLVVSLSALIGGLSAAAPASAQEFPDGVRPGGMGEAFTSSASGASAIYHNPAGAARAVMYAVDAAYEYTPTGNTLSAAIVDSKTNPGLAAGVGYAYYFARGDSDVSGHDIRLALAMPVMPDRISIGIGGRWLIVKDKELVTDETGNEVEQSVDVMNGPTLDGGIMFRATPQLHLGVVGQNLIPQCEKDACAAVAPMMIKGGVGFGTETGFLAALDAGVDLTSGDDPALIAGVGAEYLIAGMVPVRAGYRFHGAYPQHLLTVGGGWRSAVAGVDLGYQLDLQDTSQMSFMASFSIYM